MRNNYIGNLRIQLYYINFTDICIISISHISNFNYLGVHFYVNYI